MASKIIQAAIANSANTTAQKNAAPTRTAQEKTAFEAVLRNVMQGNQSSPPAQLEHDKIELENESDDDD
jgi:hypothetical protein